jgi:dTDP-glucose 4,6-dehydratase
LDKLTYAGNLENLRDIENEPNYKFVKGDIVDIEFINELFAYRKARCGDPSCSRIARRPVDHNPLEFVMTNVVGTVIY